MHAYRQPLADTGYITHNFAWIIYLVYLPCTASLANHQPAKALRGLSGLIHKEAHPIVPDLL